MDTDTLILLGTLILVLLALPPFVDASFKIYDRFKGTGIMAVDSSIPATLPPQPIPKWVEIKNFSRKASPLCIIVFILLGLGVLILEKTKIDALNSQVADLTKNILQDGPPTNVISDQVYQNERVYIDGNAYKHCTFVNVTLVFEGKKAFGFENDNFGQCNIAGPPQAMAILMILNGMGAINTNRLHISNAVLPPERPEDSN
jgi:hypothetical protein